MNYREIKYATDKFTHFSSRSTFVRFVFSKVSFGTFHWSPAHRLCGVCLPGREPSMVGKLETMEGDLAYLRHRFPSALGRGGESGEEKRVNVGGRGEKEYR